MSFTRRGSKSSVCQLFRKDEMSTTFPIPIWTDASYIPCPKDPGYVQSVAGDQCFYVIPGTRKSWLDSFTHCKNTGLRLAEPRTRKIMDSLAQRIKLQYTAFYTHIGGALIDGQWKWKTSNVSIDYDYWTDGEPNDDPNSGPICLSLLNGELTWIDVKCNNPAETWPFVCEKVHG
ncbi:collectin-10-like [Tubulanus polymorphus]|uniref:collectin-10-like n=1 Tax=Tubulanus polymorphus TaxID=672921 RepID=UPI003DA4726F